MYSLDVFSAAVFDTIVTLDDEECQVSYPLEMEDGAIAALGMSGSHLARRTAVIDAS